MKRMLLLVAGAVLVAGSAWAVPFSGGDGNPAALQGVLNGITTEPTSGVSSVNVATDFIDDANDSAWSITGAGGSVSTMIIEMAGFKAGNIFGVYNGGNYVPLFVGSAASGDQTVLSIMADGSVKVNFLDTGVDFSGNSFGYYLDSTAFSDKGGGLFHSDTDLNADGLDHMLAYQGTNTDKVKMPGYAAGLWTNNEYVLAFEDLTGPYGSSFGGTTGYSDRDFTDMVVMVESVNPVPEPATMVLLGSGLIGLAGTARRKKSKKS